VHEDSIPANQIMLTEQNNLSSVRKKQRFHATPCNFSLTLSMRQRVKQAVEWIHFQSISDLRA
jgi:transposase-like protein